MTYYTASQFKERWYMTFKDMQDGLWRISIEDPTFSGTATQLTPAANPFEWMGSGDEDQTKCILGSTGTMLIMVTNESDIADLRPTELNNRRVTAKRNDVILWQGYIKQEEYSQDWVAAPYELELPIRSALDLAQDMPLKPYEDMPAVNTVYKLFDELINQLGIDTTEWITNYKPDDVDWTLYKVHREHYYEFKSRGIESKNISDVFDSILYPYGHIREYGNKLYISLDKKSFATIFKHTVGSASGLTSTSDTVSTASLYGSDIASTENTTSIVAAPSSVSFKHEYAGDQYILKFDEDCINPNWNLAYSTTDDYYVGEHSEYCYLLSKVNIPVFQNLFSLTKLSTGKCVCDWARIIKGTFENKNQSCERVTFQTVAPLCIYMYVKNTSDSDYAKCSLKIKRHAFTSANVNNIMFSTKLYAYNGTDYNDDVSFLEIAIKSDSKWLQYDSNTNSFTFGTAETWHNMSNGNIFSRNGNELLIALNNVVDSEIELMYRSSHNGAIIFIKPEVYYKNISVITPAVKNSALIFAINDEIRYQYGGSGDSIDITFKSLNGIDYQKGDGKCYSTPEHLFCEEISYIDTQVRNKLEIDALRTSNPLVFITMPKYVQANSKYYIPVATGMNARNCTTQLRLVSTNL